MSYPPGSSRSCHEADGRSDRSGGSGGTGSGSGGGANIYGSLYGSFGENWLSPANVNSEYPSSSWQKWSTSFDTLLSDGEGVALFKAYLDSENCGNLLDFWFACQGFRSKVDPNDRKKILQLINAIYRTYIRASSTVSQPSLAPQSAVSGPNGKVPFSRHRSSQYHEAVRLRPETRRAIAERLSHKPSLDQTIFDDAQNEIGHFLRNTAYTAFLNSDVYLSHIQSVGGACHLQNTSDIRNVNNFQQQHHLFGPFTQTSCGLPTVDEDHELVSDKLPTSNSRISTPQAVISSLSQSRPPAPPPPSTGYTYSHQQSYHYFGNPYTHYQNAPPSASACGCATVQQQQHLWASPTSSGNHCFYSANPQGNTPLPVAGLGLTGANNSCCSPTTAAPLTQENIQITRFQRAELPVPQHLSSCPHCHTPFHVPPSPQLNGPQPTATPVYQQLPSQQPAYLPLKPPQTIGRKWVDAVCPKYEHCVISGDLPRPPPNPYHVSYAPVSAQDSEHHSMSSGAHTDENRSLTDSSHGDTKAACLAMFQQQQHRNSNGHHHHHHQRGGPAYPAPPSQPTSGLLMAHQQQQGTKIFGGYYQQQQLGLFSPPPPGLGSCDFAGQCNNHHRRTLRKSAIVTPAATGQATSAVLGGGNNARTSSTATAAALIKEQNMAELDPVGFAQLLTERLQRVTDDQKAIERIGKLLNERLPEEKETTTVGVTTVREDDEGKTDAVSVRQESGPRNSSSPPQHDTLGLTTSLAAINIASTAGFIMAATTQSTSISSLPLSTASTTSTSVTASVLKRPWADRLLAAARVQHEDANNAQAILEDHCSRIWATSADHTPTSSGSGTCYRVPASEAATGVDAGSGGGSGGGGGGGGGNECLAGSQNRFRSRSDDLLVEDVDEVDEDRPPRLLEEPPLSVIPPLFPSVCKRRPTISTSSTAGGDRSVSPTADEHSPRTLANSTFRHQTPISRCSSSHSSFSQHPPALPSKPHSPTGSGQRIFEDPAVSASSTTLPAPQQSTGGGLVVGYYLCDDPVPYRSQWPAQEITLGQFKHLMPKKGPFRFFFKKASDEFDSGVVQQEISNDDVTLPLWEGKVVAKVERIG